MEVSVVSVEAIKPSSLTDRPFKISLLDQITPATYGSSVFFYPSTNGYNHRLFSNRLKTSLSETLTLFYPFSGRITDNLHVGSFHFGVPFIEAYATCPMSRFLQNPELSSLNRLLPCLPFRDETSNPNIPLVAVQLTVFECGGVALGTCMSHKITDAATSAAFHNSWAAAVRDPNAPDHRHDFSEASSRFPGLDPLSKSYASVYENIWFGQSAKYKTERFVFGANALAALKKRATSEMVRKPTRVQALSGFIWKSFVDASRKASTSSPRSRVMAHAVNIRQQPGTTTTTSIGNLFWWAIAFYVEEFAAKDGDEVGRLVEVVKESISEVNSEYMKSIRGDEGFELVTGCLKQMEEMYSLEDEPEIMGITSWVNMGFKEMDFGRGKPVWVGAFGEMGPSFRNLTVLTDWGGDGEIEAWVTVEDKVLDFLKNDHHFLAFATVNPPIHHK